MNLDNWPYKQHELLKTAMEATDDYLGVEKHTMEHFKAGMKVPPTALHDFTFHMSRAHDALQALGVLDQHEDYMRYHVQQMAKMHGHDDPILADLPGTHVPTADTGEVEEQHTKVKTFNDFLKESKEEKKNLEKDEEDISDDEINQMVNGLSWEDIADFYSSEDMSDEEEDDEEEDEEELKESISASSRLKRRQQFARFKARRNIAKGLKLKRASDPATLQKRAKLAARRALYRRFLKGRNKSQLSAAEKDRLEAQVSRLKNVMSTIAQRMLPKIRQIEQKRLARQRVKK